jgi:hypothetical protein
MHNTVKLFGAMRSIAIIAFVAIIGFAVTSCGSTGGGSGGITITLPGQELRLDTWVSGNIREGESHWYRLWSTHVGGRLVVETSGNTDTVLRVYNASHDFISEDDNSGAGLNARLEMFVLPDDPYIFELKGNNSGPYQIRASVGPVQATELRLDTDVSANMREGESYWYRVRATQNGNLIVETNGSIDTALTIYDDSYNQLDGDDNSVNGNNARLSISAVNGRSYLVRFFSFNGNASGTYRIWASHTGYAPLIASNTVITEILLGDTASGNFRGGDEYWYSVRATENGYLTVGTMGSTDTYLEAYDSSYTLLAHDDDSGGGGNALLQIPVRVGQTYLFKLRGYNSSVTGPYIIGASFLSDEGWWIQALYW